MAMGGGGESRGVRAQINITPLVDVVLVLLIIFMVVTPMLRRGQPVQLPAVRTPDQESKEGDPLVLTITEGKEIYLEQERVDEAGLLAKLRQELAAHPGRKVLLRGDERLTYGEVRKVLDVVRKAGARGVRLGVQELEGR